MKKKICTLLVLIASVVSAYAQDNITAKDVAIGKGSTAVVEIDLTNAKPYGAFQFDMKLPAGFSATEVIKSSRLTSVEGKNTFSADVSITDAANNVYTVAVYNDKRMEFAGTSGAVIFVTLSEDGSNTVGAELEAQISKVALSDIDAHQTDGANSTFMITISSRTILDENSPAVPAATNGEVDLLVKRTIKANEWSTICLPFEMNEATTKQVFGDDVQLAMFDKYVKTDDKINVSFIVADLEEDGFYANWPYVIKTTKDITEFELTAAVESDEAGAVTEYQIGKKPKLETVGTFTGTLHAGTVIPDKNLFLSSNKFYYSVGKTTSKAFRAYFWFKDEVSQDSANSRVTFSIEERDVTGIKELVSQEEEKFYNLSGQQVKPEKKGLYIQNGKKKIIK